MSNTNQPFISLNISTDTVPDVSLEHDSTTDEVHIKFFNVDNELVLDLGGSAERCWPTPLRLVHHRQVPCAPHRSQQGGGRG